MNKGFDMMLKPLKRSSHGKCLRLDGDVVFSPFQWRVSLIFSGESQKENTMVGYRA